ncbi:MAG TPA: septum formation initiator family protein [Candidatus Saccharimonadales bacterium]
MNINIAHYQKYLTDLADRFRDIRFTGQVVFIGIVLLISWSGVKSIQTNYELQKQISTLKQQNAVRELENKNLELQNDYYNTEEYLELQARRNFGLGMPGEQELLVPQSVAYKYAPEVASSKVATAKDDGHTSNFQAWVNFFLNRPAN